MAISLSWASLGASLPVRLSSHSEYLHTSSSHSCFHCSPSATLTSVLFWTIICKNCIHRSMLFFHYSSISLEMAASRTQMSCILLSSLLMSASHHRSSFSSLLFSSSAMNFISFLCIDSNFLPESRLV